MSSAWGSSWGSAWGNSWGDVGVVVPPATPGIIEGAGSGKYRYDEEHAWAHVEALKAAFSKPKTRSEVVEVQEALEPHIEPARKVFFRYDLPDIRPMIEKEQWGRLEKLIARYERLVEEDDEESILLLL